MVDHRRKLEIFWRRQEAWQLNKIPRIIVLSSERRSTINSSVRLRCLNILRPFHVRLLSKLLFYSSLFLFLRSFLSLFRPFVESCLFAGLYTRAFFKRREEGPTYERAGGPRYLYNRPRGYTHGPSFIQFFIWSDNRADEGSLRRPGPSTIRDAYGFFRDETLTDASRGYPFFYCFRLIVPVPFISSAHRLHDTDCADYDFWGILWIVS